VPMLSAQKAMGRHMTYVCLFDNGSDVALQESGFRHERQVDNFNHNRHSTMTKKQFTLTKEISV